MQAIEALRQFQPGFEQAQLKNFGMTVGTRESRHIIGRAQLTENDICNEGRHADSIGVFPEFIDGNGHLKLPLEANYFQIPYGVMIPQQVENLLVCGRQSMQIISPMRQSVIWGVVLSLEKVQGLPLLLPLK